jgi:hypothetical protein
MILRRKNVRRSAKNTDIFVVVTAVLLTIRAPRALFLLIIKFSCRFEGSWSLHLLVECGLLYRENKGITTFRNVGNCLPVNTGQHPGRTEYLIRTILKSYLNKYLTVCIFYTQVNS